MSHPLLEVEDLTVAFPARRRRDADAVAVDDVSFTIIAGETLGLVGESGSGKTTIGRAVLGLVTPAAGRVVFDGRQVAGVPPGDRGALCAEIQVVFQNPQGSLNPARTVGQSVIEPVEATGTPAPEEAGRQVAGLLSAIGLPPEMARLRPRSLSGGQRQRVAIARALATSPRLIVCDEPTSALDLSTQAQVLNLLQSLRRTRGLSYLFISHNLAVVRSIADRTAVLYRGRVVERGPAGAVADHPLHPYTQALQAATLVADVAEQRERRQRRRTSASPPAQAGAATSGFGCPYADRCSQVAAVCRATRPPETAVGAQTVACHLYDPTSGHPSAPAGVDGAPAAAGEGPATADG